MADQANPQNQPAVLDGKHNTITLGWWHLKQKDHSNFFPVRENSFVEPLICGSNTLPAVCTALENAEKSIEISLWAFDPAFCLKGYYPEIVENHALLGSLEKTTRKTPSGVVRRVSKQSPRVGDILLDAALSGVQVRILVWSAMDLLYNQERINHSGSHAYVRTRYDDGASPERKRWLIDDIKYRGTAFSKNQEYRYLWFELVKSIKNIEICRAAPIPSGFLEAIVEGKIFSGYELEYKILPQLVRKGFPTHHQKTVLVDYCNPSAAVGFVMGNNIKDVDYDVPEHIYPAPPRGGKFPDTPLRQDVSTKIRGVALHDVSKNFWFNWQKAGGNNEEPQGITPAMLRVESNTEKGEVLYGGEAQVSTTLLGGISPGFIHDAYERAINCATQYLYFENQYFRYTPLASVLKARGADRQSAHENQFGQPLYFFIITNLPDNYATQASTAMLEALGHEEQMAGAVRAQYKHMLSRKSYFEEEAAARPLSPEEIDIQRANEAKIADLLRQHSKLTEADPLPESKIEEAKDAFSVQDQPGLKGLVATLMVSHFAKQVYPHVKYESGIDSSGISSYFERTMEYIPINIHSKVMIVDDAFTIIGSANMNDRGMVSDAEIDISTTRQGVASHLRSQLFRYHFGEGYEEGTDWERHYENWKKRLDVNWNLRYRSEHLKGHLMYLYDPDPHYFIPDMD